MTLILSLPSNIFNYRKEDHVSVRLTNREIASMQSNMKGGAQRIGLNRIYKLGKRTHEDFLEG